MNLQDSFIYFTIIFCILVITFFRTNLFLNNIRYSPSQSHLLFQSSLVYIVLFLLQNDYICWQIIFHFFHVIIISFLLLLFHDEINNSLISSYLFNRCLMSVSYSQCTTIYLSHQLLSVCFHTPSMYLSHTIFFLCRFHTPLTS